MECTLIILPNVLETTSAEKQPQCCQTAIIQIREFVCRTINKEFSIDSSERSVTFDVLKQGKCEKHNLVEYVDDSKIRVRVEFKSQLKLNVNDLIGRFTECNFFGGKLDYWLHLTNNQILGTRRAEIEAKINDRLSFKELSLGCVVGFNRFVEHYSSNSDKFVCLECVFEHNDKIVAKFNIVTKGDKYSGKQKSIQSFEIEIAYKTIERMIVSRVNLQRENGNNNNNKKFHGYDLFLVLNKPLKLHEYYVPQEESPFDTNNGGSHAAGDDDLSDDEAMYIEDQAEEQLPKEAQWIRGFKFGSCSPEVMAKSSVVRLRLSSEPKKSFEVLKQMVICLKDEIEVYFAHMESVRVPTPPTNGVSNSCLKGNFDCYFALQCIQSNTFQLGDEVFLKQNGPTLSRKLKEWSVENPRALELSLFEVERLLESRKAHLIEPVLFDFYSKFKSGVLKAPQLPKEMIELKRAVVTPLGISFKPSLPYLKSSLLRNCDPNYGLRVSIEDVCGSALSNSLKGHVSLRRQLVEERIRPYLESGFKVGPRQFQFFGCSTSQMREHGCFFYAKDQEGRTASHLRSLVGALDNIKTVPKYLARMGQSLSQAEVSLIIPKDKTEVVPDIIRNNYTFSDGVGRMSKHIARKIYAALQLEPDDQPSAFQIRYGGCKGMLVLDPTLQTEKIIFRQSMAKFDSPLESLEIIKISRPLKVYLNKSFIAILEHLGVSDSAFFRLQTQALNGLTASLVESEKAGELLKTEAAIRLPYTLLHRAGFDLSNEAYFRPMVMALYRKSIDELKSKARIKIPFNYGRTMFGVLDETGQLGPEEVFVQYSETIDEDKNVTTKTKVLTGDVLVTKNPCTHEGDVRKFLAVDIPELRHIVDCIVFPQTGDRPLPDQMAGSDLDGDEYCVVWLPALLFEGPNRDPLDYTNNAVAQEKSDIQVSDMCDFLCTYLLQSGVGLFANAHLVWADRVGLQSPECYALAKKYSQALDFGKTGKTPKISRRERPGMYPDFMEKESHKTTYLSTKSLGFLYRNCKRIELASEILSDTVEIKMDPDLEIEGWSEYIEGAKEAMEKYRSLLLVPARIFSLSKESEVAAGVIEGSRDPMKKRQDTNNAEKALNCLLKHSIEITKESFYREFVCGSLPHWKRVCKMVEHRFIEACLGRRLQEEKLPVLDKMLRKAVAWYKVAYDTSQEDDDARKILLGLPWVVCELLGIVKIRNREMTESKSVSLLSTKMISFVERNYSGEHDESAPQDVIALDVLKTWLRANKEFLRLREIIHLPTCHVAVQSQLRRAIEEEKLQDQSAAELVLRVLKRMSLYCCLTPGEIDDHSLEYWRLIRELGLLAFISVSNLASSGVLWRDQDDDLSLVKAEWKEVRETVVLILSDFFKSFFLGNENSIKKVLMSRTKVSSIDIDYVVFERGSKNIKVKMSVDGKKWNIQLLKDLVVQSNFRTIIRDDVRAFDDTFKYC